LVGGGEVLRGVVVVRRARRRRAARQVLAVGGTRVAGRVLGTRAAGLEVALGLLLGVAALVVGVLEHAASDVLAAEAEGEREAERQGAHGGGEGDRDDLLG